MATFVLMREDLFPVGTPIAAYRVTGWPFGGQPVVGPPPGTPVETRSMQPDGTATFTAVAERLTHVAYAQVGGEHRYVRFTVPPPSTGGSGIGPAGPPGADSTVPGPQGPPGASGSTDRGSWLPADNGYLAGNFDPRFATDHISTLNGEILWSKIWLPTSITITNLVVNVSSPGSGFSTGNLGMLYSSAGALIAKTAVQQSTNWATAQAWPMALTAEAGQSLTRGGVGVYVIGAVMSRATSSPLFSCDSTDDKVNLNLSGLGLRSGSDASDLARTTAPATLVAGNQAATFRQVWFGLT